MCFRSLGAAGDRQEAIRSAERRTPRARVKRAYGLCRFWEIRYRHGDKAALLEAIGTSFLASVEPPLWARVEFIKISKSIGIMG